MLGETIGKGAYSKVVQAKNTETGEVVAIKLMDRKFLDHEHLTEYVKKEIKVLSQLRHPNIVQLYDVLVTQTDVCLVMELINGNELFEEIAKKGALDEDTARRYILQIISAIDYCHSIGVCHRDIKLENVVVDSETQTLKLLDFGFSRHLTSFLKTAVGTPTYIAPEALSLLPGQTYDGKAVDVWSLGVMFYLMVVGNYPFGPPNTDYPTLYKRIKAAEFVQMPAGLSASCKALISSILVADPKQRITLDAIKRHDWVLSLSSKSTADWESIMSDRPGDPNTMRTFSINMSDDSSWFPVKPGRATNSDTNIPSHTQLNPASVSTPPQPQPIFFPPMEPSVSAILSDAYDDEMADDNQVDEWWKVDGPETGSHSSRNVSYKGSSHSQQAKRNR